MQAKKNHILLSTFYVLGIVSSSLHAHVNEYTRGNVVIKLFFYKKENGGPEQCHSPKSRSWKVVGGGWATESVEGPPGTS